MSFWHGSCQELAALDGGQCAALAQAGRQPRLSWNSCDGDSEGERRGNYLGDRLVRIMLGSAHLTGLEPAAVNNRGSDSTSCLAEAEIGVALPTENDGL
jgi:hypothetical protein